MQSMSMRETPVLENAWVRLEPLAMAHHDDLVAAVTPGELWRAWYTTIPSPETMAAEIAKRLADQEAGTRAPWAIVDPATGQAVGMTSYLHLAPTDRRLEIGSTWIGLAAQGTRINPAAKLLLLQRAFEDLQCVRVELRTHFQNHQSRAAIEKLGAKLDGVLRRHMILPNGTIRDTCVYSVLDYEWENVRLGLEARLAR